MYWVDLPIYLITEGCCHIDYSERNEVGTECISGLQSIFRITILMGLQEELTGHMVATEMLLDTHTPRHFAMVHDYFFRCTVLFWTGRAVQDGTQSMIGISTWRAESSVPWDQTSDQSSVTDRSSQIWAIFCCWIKKKREVVLHSFAGILG